MWGKRDKLSSTALARPPQGNLRSGAATSDDGLTGCRIGGPQSSIAASSIGFRIEGSSFSGLFTRVEIGHIRIRSAGHGKHARLFGCRGSRIGGEDGDRPGVSPDRLLGGDECWFGEPAGQVAATPIWLMNCCATLAETFGPQLGYGRHPAIPLPNFPCAWPTHPPSANKPITRQRARRSWMAAT
jgi:hypothetical protein